MKRRASALPTADSNAPATLADTAKAVAWGLVFWFGEQLVAATFTANRLGSEAMQAALAEWGAARMAIVWSEPDDRSWRAVGQRVARGAAIGFAAAGVVAVAALAARTAVSAPGEGAGASLLVGLVVAGLASVRDELLLRGVVLRATRLLPVPVALIACGLAAASARFGTEGLFTSALISEALRGVALGALWLRDRGAWMACAANTAWSWTMDSLLGGDLLDVRFSTHAGADSATASVVLAVGAVVASVGVLAAARAQRPAP